MALLIDADFAKLDGCILQFCAQPSGPVSPGDVIHLDLQIDTLTDHREMSRRMADLSLEFAGNYLEVDIAYEQIGLLTYRVTHVKDCSALLHELAASRACKSGCQVDEFGLGQGCTETTEEERCEAFEEESPCGCS